MKFEVYTDEFKKAIDKVSKVVPNKHVVPIVESIKVDIADDICYLSGSNLTQYIKTKMEASFPINTIVETSFVLQDIKQLLKAIKYFNDVMICFEINENNLVMSCGTKKIEQALRFEAKEYIDFPNFDAHNEYNYNVKKLADRFNAVKYAVAKNDYKPILTGVHMDRFDMVTLDGYRMAINKDEQLEILNPLTIPVDAFKYATTLLSGDITIRTDNKYIEIRDRDTILCSRILEGDYIDYKKIIPDNKIAMQIDSKEYLNELKYLNEFAEDPYHTTAFYNGKLEVISSTGRYKTEVPVKGDQSDFIIAFDCRYMIDALNNQFDGDVNYKINNQISPIMLSDNRGNTALVLAVKVRDDNDYFKDELSA